MAMVRGRSHRIPVTAGSTASDEATIDSTRPAIGMLVKMKAVGSRRQLAQVGDHLQTATGQRPEGEMTQGGAQPLIT